MHRSTTGESLVELLFKRVLNTKIPEVIDLDDDVVDISDQGARDCNTQTKQVKMEFVHK